MEKKTESEMRSLIRGLPPPLLLDSIDRHTQLSTRSINQHRLVHSLDYSSVFRRCSFSVQSNAAVIVATTSHYDRNVDDAHYWNYSHNYQLH